ncbi:MAG: pyridoxamine 5'-phosphate oxidase family protein [Pseudomonas sp.]|nr:pyridoxamine 5'-phosphate oxidase family protein [Pseudomonas sp.]
MESFPWHAGELQLQQRAGVAERMAVVGRRAIGKQLPDQHRQFYPLLPYLVMGGVDADGRPWATMLEGPPGFAHSPGPQVLRLDSLPGSSDPLAVAPGSAVGLLGIDLNTRRRNRVNGQVAAVDDQGFSVAVAQAFGNCPQYIQLRAVQSGGVPEKPGPVERAPELNERDRQCISRADTFFVASFVDEDGDPERRSVDVSHRGGNPGFVRVQGNVLTIPDFAGNLFFNTLGNLLLNPMAGLLFVDFATGDLLHLSGRTEILLQSDEIAAFQGAERLWQLTVEQVVRRPAALALRWQLHGVSPTSQLTGDWVQAAARLQADALRDTWRPWRVTRIVDESRDIRSFYLAPDDGAGLPRFDAGQHVPVRIALSPGQAPVIGTYSLSSAPSDDFLRISVKRDGRVSAYLHDQVGVGDVIQARAPQGRFSVQAQARRPLVLLAAGVGVTPLLSMLREVVYQGQRTRRTRPTWFIQSARHLADLAFGEELQALQAQAGDALQVIRLLSQPEACARAGQDYHGQGRIDIALLKAVLSLDDFDFYLCGPGTFTQALYDGLRDLHLQDDRIHAETFGPSSLKRTQDKPVASVQQPPAASAPVPVVFASSGQQARWKPGGGSLLELAESRGLAPEFSCRGGSCGTCATRLVSGQVHYPSPPAELPAPGEVLICCAVPAQGADPLVLAL